MTKNLFKKSLSEFVLFFTAVSNVKNVVSKSETKPRTEFPETWLWTEDRL